jgi:DNA-binding CsgD family transcriptional regulator
MMVPLIVKPRPPLPFGLTQYEHDIIVLAGEGILLPKIAERACMSVRTIEAYALAAQVKINARSLAQAAVLLDRVRRAA